MNTKLQRKNPLILALCAVGIVLLLTALLTLHASASDSKPEQEKPYIGAYTLALHDSVHIDFAVKVPDGADAAGVLVWERTAPDKFVHDGVATDIKKDSGYQDIGETRYRVFVYTDVSAKEFADDFYAVPYIVVDGKYIYGEPTKYGVLYYAEAKKDDPDLSKLLASMLKYGAAAQKYFAHNTQNPANDPHVRLEIENAVLLDTLTYAMCRVGAALPTPYPSVNGEVFAGWYLDAEFTVKIDTVPDQSTTIYAKWSEPLTATSFCTERAPSTTTYGNAGFRFNTEGTATLTVAKDASGRGYLDYTSGAGTTAYASKTDLGFAPADMKDTDVFSYSFELSASNADILTTASFGLASDKNSSGSNYTATVDLLKIASDGTVTTYGGTTLGVLSEDEISKFNVAVNYADSTFSYYSEDGALITTEEFTVPSKSGARTAKAWQSLMKKYFFYAEFESGNALRFYGITIAEGNIFA